MSQQHFLDSNRIWFTIVLLHIAGSVLDSLLGMIPLGRVIAAATIWFFIANMQMKNMCRIGVCIIGWILTVLVMCSLGTDYQGTILLNELLLLYVVWVCQKAYVNPLEYFHLKKISLKKIILVVFVAIFLFIMSGYINACSMLIFQNLLQSSLQGVADKPLEALIAFAIMPAIIEEILFRGMIYRGIFNKGDRRIAIIISAVLFALLHMNFNQMCYAFIMGIAFALVIYVTDNLTVSILLHMLFNSFTVIIYCFEDKKIIQTLLRCKIAGYALFNPLFTGADGQLETSLLIIGAIIAVLSTILAGYLIILIGKTEKATQEKEREGKVSESLRSSKTLKISRASETPGLCSITESKSQWKPDLQFLAGSIICLIVAVLYEILL